MKIFIPETTESLVTDRLRRLTRRLAAAGVSIEGGLLGGADGYGADFSNDVFTMRQHTEDPQCSCGVQNAGYEGPPDAECARDCPFNLPQFKCGEFEVRWHKWIGRSLDVSGPEMSDAELSALFDRCEASVRELPGAAQ